MLSGSSHQGRRREKGARLNGAQTLDGIGLVSFCALLKTRGNSTNGVQVDTFGCRRTTVLSAEVSCTTGRMTMHGPYPQRNARLVCCHSLEPGHKCPTIIMYGGTPLWGTAGASRRKTRLALCKRFLFRHTTAAVPEFRTMMQHVSTGHNTLPTAQGYVSFRAPFPVSPRMTVKTPLVDTGGWRSFEVVGVQESTSAPVPSVARTVTAPQND